MIALDSLVQKLGKNICEIYILGILKKRAKSFMIWLLSAGRSQIGDSEGRENRKVLD